ncbi:SET domain-containing protein-lysine N-methyltransferase [Sulfidibacter corallicola]|uniref:SET domain-containing protein-lysine N-methyltransferase n=1 Tax=Sulfidibacter corallicola TaxID=2818388 RepID=A0A8A4TKX8_SULCO|nr:SET domain-containing protein-lysine N-methyltransferase [Sulfidibacter corallicola]QTD49531.1 SET domain-containing protein-lysine N-methyltransferase [Sulfidibacter corallicola]
MTDNSGGTNMTAVQALLDWVRDNGGSFPGQSIREQSAGGRGVFAEVNLIRHGTVLEIPRHLILCMDLARRSPLGRALAEKGITPRSSYTLLALLLLQEDAAPDSFWRPYLDSLPRAYPESPVYFDDPTLALLQGSYTLSLIAARREQIEAEYAMVHPVLPSRPEFRFEAFRWAMVTVISRGFAVLCDNGHNEAALVPLLDMFNHRTDNGIEGCYRAERAQFVLHALHDHEPGGELFISYGTYTTAQFFVNYGFVDTNSREGEARVVVELDQRDAWFQEKRKAFNGVTQVDLLLATSDVDSLLACLRFLRFSASGGHGEGRFVPQLALQPRDPAGELAVAKAFRLACEAALDTFPTSLAEDESFLRQGLNQAMMGLVRMRVSEKAVLHRAVEFARSIESFLADWEVGGSPSDRFASLMVGAEGARRRWLEAWWSDIGERLIAASDPKPSMA